MIINILAFGITREIFGASAIDVELSDAPIVSELKSALENQYPRLKKLATYMVAINSAYAQNEDNIQPNDEVALIPPVSGG